LGLPGAQGEVGVRHDAFAAVGERGTVAGVEVTFGWHAFGQ